VTPLLRWLVVCKMRWAICAGPVRPRRVSVADEPDQARPPAADGAGVEASVGMVGDALDNALAESVIGLFNTELPRRRGAGETSDMSKQLPCTGSTGSTGTDCWRPTATCHR
jgi:hypothetical protein